MSKLTSKMRKISPRLGKVALLALLCLITIGAIFNLRLGFGAQAIDCIDGYLHVVRYNVPANVERGKLIVFVAPEKLGYPFANHLFIKTVGAVAGDQIKVEKGVLHVNQVAIGNLDIADKAANQLGVMPNSFELSEIVPEGYVFAMGTRPRSFDSRYWGLLPVSSIIGTAYRVF